MIKKENLNIGDEVYFPHKSKPIKAVVMKKNQKTATVKVEKTIFRVPYLLLFEDESLTLPVLSFKKTNIDSDLDLLILVEELKEEYEIFKSFNSDQKRLLNSVKIKWNSKITFRVGGNYYKSGKTGALRNEILISRSFQNTPKYLIKFVLYHELLHIKYRNHSRDFRIQEQKFKDYEKAKELFEGILLEIRINGIKRFTSEKSGH
jgi:hypothetical protein